jgi:hypothetical protein
MYNTMQMPEREDSEHEERVDMKKQKGAEVQVDEVEKEQEEQVDGASESCKLEGLKYNVERVHILFHEPVFQGTNPSGAIVSGDFVAVHCKYFDCIEHHRQGTVH